MRRMILILVAFFIVLSACGQSKFVTDQLLADSIAFTGSGWVNEFSIDGTMDGNSDRAVPTEKAVKTYVGATHDTAGIGIRIASILDDTSKYINRYDTATWATQILSRVTADDTAGIGIRISSIIDDTSKYINRYDTATWSTQILSRITADDTAGIGIRIASIIDDTSKYVNRYDTAIWATGIIGRVPLDTKLNKADSNYTTQALETYVSGFDFVEQMGLKADQTEVDALPTVPEVSTLVSDSLDVLTLGVNIATDADSILVKQYDSLKVLVIDVSKLADTNEVRTIIRRSNFDNSLEAMEAMGSNIKAQTIGVTNFTSGDDQILEDGYCYLLAVYLQEAATLTGVYVTESVLGDYTADAGVDRNKVGLYTVSGGTLTLVDSSANNVDQWKTNGDLVTIPFHTTYVAAAGLYYVGLLSNFATVSTAPRLVGIIMKDSDQSGDTFANGLKISMIDESQADLGTSVTASNCVQFGTAFWVALY